MIELLTHILVGIGIGGYIFNSTIRGRVNGLLRNIGLGLIDMLRGSSTKQTPKKVSRATTTKPQAQSPVQPPSRITQGQYICKCGGIIVPANGQMKGYGVCINCQTFQPLMK